MGTFFGVLFTCALGWGFDANFSEGMTKLYTFVVSALLSLLVAAFAVAGVFANIASQREKDADTRQRKLLAANAKLPFALAEMSKACTEGVRLTVAYPDIQSQLTEKHPLWKQSAERLRLSDETLRTLEQAIEYHNDVEVAHRMLRFLQLYQTSTQRLLAKFEPPTYIQTWGEGHPMEVRAVEWALLGAIVVSLFRYSREGTLPSVSEDTIRIALQFDLPSDAVIRNIEEYQRGIQSVFRRYLEHEHTLKPA